MISKMGSSESNGQANFVKFPLSCEMNSFQTHTHTREQKTSYRIVFSLFCFAFTVVAANYLKMQRISDAHFRFHHSCWLLKKNTHTHNCELFRKKSEKIEQDQAKMLHVVSQWSCLLRENEEAPFISFLDLSLRLVAAILFRFGLSFFLC